MVSGMTNYTNISIDPVVRSKAEKILENQRDKVNLSQLDVINEEENKLTSQALKNLESTVDLGGMECNVKSIVSKIKSARNDPFENKSFTEDSRMDQDDAYGNHRPAFLVKKSKVTGRTTDIMKL